MPKVSKILPLPLIPSIFVDITESVNNTQNTIANHKIKHKLGLLTIGFLIETHKSPLLDYRHNFQIRKNMFKIGYTLTYFGKRYQCDTLEICFETFNKLVHITINEYYKI